MDPTPTLTQLKRPHIQEKPTTWKKTKVAKPSKRYLLNSGERVRDVTKDALAELMMKQTTALGTFKVQLQALQI